MLEIKFQIGGRTVNPQNIKNTLEGAVLQSVQSAIKKSVGSLRCPKHGLYPKIVAKGRNLKNLSFEVSGCCETLITQVKKKLN